MKTNKQLIALTTLSLLALAAQSAWALKIDIPKELEAEVEAQRAAEQEALAAEIESIYEGKVVLREGGAMSFVAESGEPLVEPETTVETESSEPEYVDFGAMEVAGPEAELTADEGRIYGQIIDQDTSVPLAGVAILLETGVEGEEVGTITDANGEYAIGPVGAGVYTLSMFKDGYIGSTVTDYEIEGGLDKQFAFALPLRPAEMSDEAYELTGFTVSADEANDMMMKLDLKFNSDRALDVMSAEDFSKFAASDVADAVKRIAGVSVNDGKFPSVRGLNDRYTVTTLNGMPLPSPDPFRKSPQFDMFPSSLLDSIVVSKSATADLAGESTAANFDLITKRLPEERILKFSFGLGVNENAWDDFRDFDRPSSYWYADAADDFDPAPRENYEDPNVRPGYDPTDEFLSKRASKRPDMSFSGTYGETFEFRNDRRLGVVASGYYKIKRETLSDATRVDDYDFESAQVLRPDEDPRVINIGQPSYIQLDDMGNFAGFVPVASYVPVNGVEPERGVDPLFFGDSVVNVPYGDETTYDFSAYSESVLLGGLAGLTYEMGDDHVVGTNLFHSRTSDTYVGHAVNGINPGENIAGTVLELERETLYYVERSLTALQLFGEHRLTSIPVFDSLFSWGYQHARANQDEPDFRDTVRVLDQDGNRRNVNSTDNIAYSSRSWRSVDEEEDSLRLDLELDLDEKTNAFIGYARSDADRTSEVQTYIERRTDTFSTGEIVIPDGPIDSFLATDGIRGESDSERTIDAVYGMVQRDINEFIGLNFGVRWEDSVIGVESDTQLDSAGTLADVFRLFDSARFVDPPNEVTQILSNQADILGVPVGYSNTTGSDIETELLDELYLPSVLVTLKPAEALQIKLGYFETINRPSFREITGDIFVDSLTGDRLAGNPFLKSSRTDNYDFRVELRPADAGWELPFWEGFLTDGDMLGVSLFKKEITDPIEFLQPTAAGTIDEIPFNNTEGADAEGIEVEFNKNLSFIGVPYAEYFSFGGNISWTDAVVGVSQAEKDLLGLNDNIDGDALKDERPLTEQPDRIVNLNLNFEQPEWGFTATLAYNFKTEILESIGSQDELDAYRGESERLDLVLSKSFDNGLTLKFSIKNLLDDEEEAYFRNRAPDYNNPDIPNMENPSSFGEDLSRISGGSIGRTFAISASYEF